MTETALERARRLYTANRPWMANATFLVPVVEAILAHLESQAQAARETQRWEQWCPGPMPDSTSVTCRHGEMFSHWVTAGSPASPATTAKATTGSEWDVEESTDPKMLASWLSLLRGIVIGHAALCSESLTLELVAKCSSCGQTHVLDADPITLISQKLDTPSSVVQAPEAAPSSSSGSSERQTNVERLLAHAEDATAILRSLDNLDDPIATENAAWAILKMGAVSRPTAEEEALRLWEEWELIPFGEKLGWPSWLQSRIAAQSERTP